jgi:hypothetical protein
MSGAHHRSMDDIYLCPDCHAEHTEPQDAALGHLARCLTCAVLFDALTEEQMLDEQIAEIRVAA